MRAVPTDEGLGRAGGHVPARERDAGDARAADGGELGGAVGGVRDLGNEIASAAVGHAGQIEELAEETVGVADDKLDGRLRGVVDI